MNHRIIFAILAIVIFYTPSASAAIIAIQPDNSTLFHLRAENDLNGTRMRDMCLTTIPASTTVKAIFVQVYSDAAALAGNGDIALNVATYSQTDCNVGGNYGGALSSDVSGSHVLGDSSTPIVKVTDIDYISTNGANSILVQIIKGGNYTDLVNGFYFFGTAGTEPFVAVSDNIGDEWASTTPSTTTRIDSVTPSDRETVATSTAGTISAAGYISSSDFSSGMFVRVRYARASDALYAISNIDSLFTTKVFPITAAGYFYFSTTTSLLETGGFLMDTSIRDTSILNNVLDFLGFSSLARASILVATSTHFTVATSSDYDLFVQETVHSLETYAPTSSAACFQGFSVSGCINYLLVPNFGLLSAELVKFRDGFLSYWPWGYITRFMVIVSGFADRTPLPTFTVPFTFFGNEGGENFAANALYWTIDWQEMADGGKDLLDNELVDIQSGMTFQEEWQGTFEQLLAIIILFIIIFDLVRLRNKRGSQH